jgi:hypothetical protein
VDLFASVPEPFGRGVRAGLILAGGSMGAASVLFSIFNLKKTARRKQYPWLYRGLLLFFWSLFAAIVFMPALSIWTAITRPGSIRLVDVFTGFCWLVGPMAVWALFLFVVWRVRQRLLGPDRSHGLGRRVGPRG